MTAIPMHPQPQQFGPMWRALRERLSTIELQLAQFGDLHAPAHLLVERDKVQTELEMIERVNEPQPSKELFAAVDDHIRYHAVMSAVMSLSGRLYEAQRDLRTLAEHIDRIESRLLWLLPGSIIGTVVLVAVVQKVLSYL